MGKSEQTQIPTECKYCGSPLSSDQIECFYCKMPIYGKSKPKHVKPEENKKIRQLQKEVDTKNFLLESLLAQQRLHLENETLLEQHLKTLQVLRQPRQGRQIVLPPPNIPQNRGVKAVGCLGYTLIFFTTMFVVSGIQILFTDNVSAELWLASSTAVTLSIWIMARIVAKIRMVQYLKIKDKVKPV